MTQRAKIAAGNWKLHKNASDTAQFVKELKSSLPQSANCQIIIAPPATSLMAAAELLKGQSAIELSAQNCYHKDEGAFTGEISTAHIKELGCSSVIIGHSERRSIFKETDADISLKVKAAIGHGLLPIFCIGETLEEREGGKLEAVLERQIVYGLEGVEVKAGGLVVAYEPVWAIGTGKVASPADAQAAHAFVRSKLKSIYGDDFANATPILYGGSVKPDNVVELIGQTDIDGALVGGASLKADSFGPIVEAISNA